MADQDLGRSQRDGSTDEIHQNAAKGGSAYRRTCGFAAPDPEVMTDYSSLRALLASSAPTNGVAGVGSATHPIDCVPW